MNRPRAGRELAQGHAANLSNSWDWNPDLTSPGLATVNSCPGCLSICYLSPAGEPGSIDRVENIFLLGFLQHRVFCPFVSVWGFTGTIGAKESARGGGMGDNTCLIDLILCGVGELLCQSCLQDLGHISHPIPGGRATGALWPCPPTPE